MEAAILSGKNQPLTIEDHCLPEIGAQSALIRVSHAALNHRDVWIQKGMYAGLKYPIILGSDGVGVVESVGNNVDKSWIGKEVIINPGQKWGNNQAFQGNDFKILGLPDNGTFAEKVLVEAAYLHEKPKHLTSAEAASLPLAGLTAYRALFSRADLKPGEKLLISGAGGGVAQFGLQFGLAAGAEVWVTSGSEEKIANCVSLGAKGGANYREENWYKALGQKAEGFDVILDGAGGDGFANLLKVANSGGRIAIYGGTQGNINKLSPQILFWKQVSILGSTMGSPIDFQKMLDFVAEHKVQPTVDKIFPLQEINAAFERMEAGKQLGKIVVEMSV